MTNRLRHGVLLLAFGFNALALFAGVSAILTTEAVDGAEYFFSIVLVVAPLLSMVVFADRGWTNSS